MKFVIKDIDDNVIKEIESKQDLLNYIEKIFLYSLEDSDIVIQNERSYIRIIDKRSIL